MVEAGEIESPARARPCWAKARLTHCRPILSLGARVEPAPERDPHGNRKDHASPAHGVTAAGMPVNSLGGWRPPELNAKFPDQEPWFVTNGECFREEPTPEEGAQTEAVRVLCPKCQRFSVEFGITALRD